MKFDVVIPDWSEGCPLRIGGIEADDKTGAEKIVVEWVNRRAGYDYCQKLPDGTKFFRSQE